MVTYRSPWCYQVKLKYRIPIEWMNKDKSGRSSLFSCTHNFRSFCALFDNCSKSLHKFSDFFCRLLTYMLIFFAGVRDESFAFTLTKKTFHSMHFSQHTFSLTRFNSINSLIIAGILLYFSDEFEQRKCLVQVGG